METVSIQIPAGLYTALFRRFGESTTLRIAKHLAGLLTAEPARTVSSGPAARNPTPYRPRRGTITGRVWEIADQMLEQAGQVDRAALLKACVDEGIKINTASTQYSHWRKFQAL